MQTFLPYESFEDSASCLDWKRLGKQRVECKQILNILIGTNTLSRWRNHPAVLMWRGFENALMDYTNCMIIEWINRGFNNNMEFYDSGRLTYPVWLGNKDFHASHRSNLLRKDAIHYGHFNWAEPNNLPYFWPTKEGY